jgi:signal transduction histidine kinase
MPASSATTVRSRTRRCASEEFAARPATPPDAGPLNEALRQLSARAEAAREDERARIARELHDELGQLLTGLKIDITWLAHELTRDPERPTNDVVNKLQAMAGLVELSMKTIQQIASRLRPAVLDHFGLVEALHWEAGTFEQRTGIRCRVTARTAASIAPERATGVFRIFQEALTNVARHAHAGAVRISVRDTKRDLVLDIRDNGRGITEAEAHAPQSTGLLGMRERARLLGGELTVTGTRGRGTRVGLRVPR